MAARRGRKATGGLGPGTEGRAAGPTPERARLRLDRLVHGPGERGVQGLTTDDALEYGPGSARDRVGPPAVRRAHAAHRGLAPPPHRRRGPDPFGPGAAAHPVAAGPGTLTEGGSRPAQPLALAGGGLGRVRLRKPVCSQHDPDMPASTNRREGWFGRFKPQTRSGTRVEGRGGHPQLRAPDGPGHGPEPRQQEDCR